MNWWLALALTLPVVISYRAMETIGPPRFMLLSLFCLAFILYFSVFQAARLEVRRPRPLIQLLGVLAAGFFLIQLMSSFSAVNPQEALYCTARYLLALIATILFALTVLREEDLLLRLCKGLAIVLAVESLVAIVQFYGLAFTNLPPQTARPYGLMANRNLLGSALALLFPFCGYLAYAGNRQWRILSSAAIWLGTYALILAQTRTAWVALSCGIAVSTLFVLLLRGRLGPALVKGWFKGLGLFVLGTVLALALSLAIKNDQGLSDSLKSRAISLAPSSVASARDESFRSRVTFWQKTLSMVRDHAIFGVGPGNWSLVAPNYGFDTSTSSQGVINVLDRAHNVYVQNAAETGIPGLVAYLGLLGVAALLAIRVILKTDQNDRRFLGIMSLAVMSAYAVDSLASFPNESFAHWLFLAFAVGTGVALYQKLDPPSATPQRAFAWSKAWLLLPALFLTFCVYLGFAKETFEYHRKRARAYNDLGNYAQVLVEAEVARTPLVKIDPVGLPLEFWTSRAYKGLGDLDAALDAIQRARAICPWNVVIWNDMGVLYVAMKRWDEAFPCFQEALRMAPAFDAALNNLAAALYQKSRFQECYETLLKSRMRNDDASIKLMCSVCLKLQKYDEGAAAAREGLAKSPDSPDLLENLAYVEYTHLNDLTNAYAHFQRLLVLRPNHPKRDEYTRVIKYLAPRVGNSAAEPAKPEAAK